MPTILNTGLRAWLLRLTSASVKDATSNNAIFLWTYARALGVLANYLARRDPFRAVATLLRSRRVARSFAGERQHRLLGRLLTQSCFSDGTPNRLIDNVVLRRFVTSPEAIRMRRAHRRLPPDGLGRMRGAVADDDNERQGNIIALKPANLRTGEKGVILIKYTESIRILPAVFDLPALAQQFRIVLEPSSWGYEDLTFLLYLGRDTDVIVQCPWEPDFRFIQSLRANLVPVRLGAGDWVDPTIFRPSTLPRLYDIAMVSGWSPLKRHSLMFRTLARIRRNTGRMLRAALIGYPQGWTVERVQALAEAHGVREQCAFFDRLPYAEVAQKVSRSGVYILLSKREGANKALYESLFSNTPVIVDANHRGVNLDHITPQTGLAFQSDRDLEHAVLRAVDGSAQFRPREWALANTGFENSTKKVNELLKALATKQGEIWTCDIVPKKNAPNLRYVRQGDSARFAATYDHLAELLLPAESV